MAVTEAKRLIHFLHVLIVVISDVENWSRTGAVVNGYGIYISSGVAHTICSSGDKFRESQQIQPPAKSMPIELEESAIPCAWFRVVPGNRSEPGSKRKSTCESSFVNQKSCNMGPPQQSSSADETQMTEKSKPKQGGFLCQWNNSTPSSSVPQDGPRIVGGEEAKVHEFPEIVSLMLVRDDGNLDEYCGGSLYNEEWVITAAHCYSKDIKYAILAGHHDVCNFTQPEVQRSSVAEFIVHEDYGRNSTPERANGAKKFRNDIALIRLAQPFTLTEFVQAAKLPLPDFRPEEGTVATVAGWGLQTGLEGMVATVAGWGLQTGADDEFYYNPLLQKVDVPIISDDACGKLYDTTIPESMICAGLLEGGKDSCQGDSGGPFFVDDAGVRLMSGIVSWGQGCALPGKPGVYTEVAYFIDWIHQHICSSN